MRRFHIFLAGVLLLSLIPSGVRAQRHAPGRVSLELSTDYGRDGLFAGFLGGSVKASHYGFHDRIVYGVDVVTSPLKLAVPEIMDGDVLVRPSYEEKLRSVDVTAQFGYLYRVLSTRSRSVSLSLGASGGIGASICSPLADYTDADDNPYSTVGFLLYVSPEAEFEVFPFRNASLFVAARPRVSLFHTLDGSVPLFRMLWVAGFKYYL